MGITAAIVGGIGAGFGISKLMSSGAPKAPEPTPLPQPPSQEDAQGKAEQVAQRRRNSITETTFTSPLGSGGEAQLARKVLLGQ